MQTLSEIKALLASRALRPKRSLGQNFLIDHNLVRKVVDAAEIAPGNLVLEVGPGTGTMTEELLSRGAEVIACELDDNLADLLRERRVAIPGGDRLRVITADCLAGKHELNPAIVGALAARPFKLVANLPYGAATPLIATLLTDFPACSLLSVTVQRELADRLCAAPGCKDFGPLGVLAQSLAHLTRVASAPPSCFWPRPDVTSTLLLIRRRPDPLTRDPRSLTALCRTLFAHRRKQLGSAIRELSCLAPAPIDWGLIAHLPGCRGIRPELRAEQLSIQQIIALGDALARQGVNPGADAPPHRGIDAE